MSVFWYVGASSWRFSPSEHDLRPSRPRANGVEPLLLSMGVCEFSGYDARVCPHGHRTTVDEDAAAEEGISAGTICTYFDRKKGLLKAVFQGPRAELGAGGGKGRATRAGLRRAKDEAEGRRPR